MITLKRLPDWRARYGVTVDQIKAQPFAYGTQDCALGLAAMLVEAVTGTDVAAAYRGKYADQASGQALMKGAGFANLADLVASILPEIPEGVARAQVGDIAAIPDSGPLGFSLGVVNGERIYVLRPNGLGTVDLLKGKRAFKVG